MAAEEPDPAGYEVLTGLGVDDAGYRVLKRISGELLNLGNTRVADFQDPQITNDAEPDGYETLVSIAKVLADNGPAREPTQEHAQISRPLAELLNAETQQLLLDALNYLDYVFSECEQVVKDLSLDPTGNDFVLVDQARSVVLLLFVQGIRVAREIRWLLMGGFPDAAWARWRTLHELAVTAAFMIDSEDPDMPTRYLAHADALKRKLTRVIRQHGLLTDEKPDGDSQSTDQPAASGKDDYSWVTGQSGEKHHGGFAGLERKAGLDEFRPFYTMANGTIHADAASLYRARPVDGRPLINGAVSSDFYLPVHLTLRSLRILVSSVLLGSARRESGERVVGLMDYFTAVIHITELARHCEEMFGQYDDALGD